MENTTQQRARRPLKDLNVIDGFLFKELIEDEDCNVRFSEMLLTEFLGENISVSHVVSERSFNGVDKDCHGIRLDAYIEGTGSGKSLTVYDLEPEVRRADKQDIPRRARFYSSLMDVNILQSGKRYRELPDLVTVFIMNYDPFDLGDMLYEAGTTLRSHPKFSYDDGIRRLFLFTRGKYKKSLGERGKRLRNLLRYMDSSVPENVVDPQTEELDQMVNKIKSKKGMGLRYMQWWEMIESAKEDAREEVREEAHKKGLAEGHEKGLVEGLAEGHEKGLAEGLSKGRSESAELIQDLQEKNSALEKAYQEKIAIMERELQELKAQNPAK